jgi:hypothetical protein
MQRLAEHLKQGMGRWPALGPRWKKRRGEEVAVEGRRRWTASHGAGWPAAATRGGGSLGRRLGGREREETNLGC